MSREISKTFRLIYDGIELVLSRKNLQDSFFDANTTARWALPGGTLATTNQLVSRANARGKQVQLLTIAGSKRRFTLLTEENVND